MNKMIQKAKEKTGYFLAKANLMAVGLSMAMYNTAYADTLSDTLQANLTSITEKAIGALAAIIGISALITGAMAVKDMAEGSQSSNPEMQNKGQKTLTAALGMAVAAGILLGTKGTIVSFITAAMSGS